MFVQNISLLMFLNADNIKELFILLPLLFRFIILLRAGIIRILHFQSQQYGSNSSNTF